MPRKTPQRLMSTHPKAWRTSAGTLAVACLCATALAAPPGLGLPDMPPEKPGPTAADLDAQKRASQQAVQQAERRAAEQRAAAQREADQAKADKAAAEARAKKEQQAREAAEAKTQAAEAKTRDLERKLAEAEANAKAAREAQEKAKAAAEPAKKEVTPPPPASIPDFTRLPSVAGGPVFVALPLGSFEMGSTSGGSDEKPPHPVRVSQRIAMSEMEVTTAQYMDCANDTRQGKPACDQPEWNETGSQYNLETGNHKHYKNFVANDQPVVGVTWHNARQYAAWLSRETGHSYKLPTEAEWEFACRAGGTHTYCGSDDVNAVAWYSDNTKFLFFDGASKKVGTKAKNAWGLFDMSGNVLEWVADCYNDKEYQRRKDQGGEWPAHQTSTNSDDPQTKCSRVLRGGSWYFNAYVVRSADRSYYSPVYRIYGIGFRLSRTLP